MTEWIEHDGKSRPNLPARTLVATRHSNGWEDGHHKSHPTWEFWDELDDEDSSWISTDGDDYITHYLVVQS